MFFNEGVGTLLIIIAPEKTTKKADKISSFIRKYWKSIKARYIGIIIIPAAAGEGIPTKVLDCSFMFSILNLANLNAAQTV